MNGFLFDTNIPSELTRVHVNAKVQAWVREQDDATLYLSAISVGELRKGIEILPEGQRRERLRVWLDNELLPLFEDRVLPITQAVAERWGVLSAQRKMAGRPLGMADGLIAATAAEHELTVVTRNVRDFQELGVAVLNPWEKE